MTTRTQLAFDVADVLGQDARVHGFVDVPDERGEDLTLVYWIVGGQTAVASLASGIPGYDVADEFAAMGCAFAAVDHPGIASSTPVADPFDVSVEAVTACHARAVAQIATDIGATRVVGAGHSMGGMFTLLVQHLAQPYAQLVLLGHGGGGLPEVIGPAEMAIAELPRAQRPQALRDRARQRFGPATVRGRGLSRGTFYTDDTPVEVVDALRSHAAALLPVPGLATLIPGLIAEEQAAVDVPVFLGIGEHDLIDDPHAVAAAYRGTGEVWMFVVPGAGHNMMAAGRRGDLWERVAAFVRL